MRNKLYQRQKRIPRGEMWLGHGLFRDLGWEDNLESRLRLCHDLAMDIVFLPAASAYLHYHLFDYRYFSPDDIHQLVTAGHSLLVGAIISGPFQQLSQKLGLQPLLHQWLTPGMIDKLQAEATEVEQLFSACLNSKPDVIVIADDIAYHHSTLVNPSDLKSLFISYREWVQQAHKQGITILFHSDGRLTDILSSLLACGFDGLAACQLEYLNLNHLKQPHKPKPVLLAGIPDDLLETEELDSSHKKQFAQLLTNLTSAGNLVLCSSSGISSARRLHRLGTLYQWADEFQGSHLRVKRHQTGGHG